LCPSPPTRHRGLTLQDDGQLSLPFLTEAEISAPAVGVDHTCNAEVEHLVPSISRRSSGKTLPRLAGAIERASALKQKASRKTAKRKPPNRASLPPDSRLLVSRKVSAEMLSISVRGVDYMIADGRLSTRRIANRVLIPIEEIRKFATSDHPGCMAG